jgi:hypothetical protein
MKITGTVDKIYLEDIKFIELLKKENLCQESLTPFNEDEPVVVISLGKFKNNSVELADGIFFVKPEYLEDFIIRFKSSITNEHFKSTTISSENNVPPDITEEGIIET